MGPPFFLPSLDWPTLLSLAPDWSLQNLTMEDGTTATERARAGRPGRSRTSALDCPPKLSGPPPERDLEAIEVFGLIWVQVTVTIRMRL